METKIWNQRSSQEDSIPTPTNGNSAGQRDLSRNVDSLFPKEDTLRKRVLCPSAPAEVKAILLGVIQSDGSVAFIKDRIEVTQEFLDIAAKGRTPETRFRFSSTCLGSACKQWANNKCSLPEHLADLVPRANMANAPDASLPSCSIKDQCRWFEQRGSEACRICSVVVTRGDP